MHLVVTYDVSTESRAGRRRLRRVAKICEDYGQRVQLSVFECSVDEMQLDAMISALEQEIDPGQDSLRIYRLHGQRNSAVQSFGRDDYRDFSGEALIA